MRNYKSREDSYEREEGKTEDLKQSGKHIMDEVEDAIFEQHSYKRGGSDGHPESPSRLQNIVMFLLFLSAFVVPVFFYALPGLPISASKGAALSILVFGAFFFFLLLLLRRRNVALSKSFVWVGLCLWILSAFLSSFVTSSLSYSLFGRGISMNTFLFTVVLVLLTFLFSQFFKRRKHIQFFFFLFFILFFVLFLFHLTRFFFGPDFLAFGYFTSLYTSLLGGWYDVPMFFGFSALIGLVSYLFLWKGRGVRIVSIVMVCLSLLSLATFSNQIALILLAIFSFGLLIFSLSSSDREGGLVSFLRRLARPFRGEQFNVNRASRGNSIVSAGVLVVSLILLLFGASITGTLSRVAGLDNTIQVRPSMQSTVSLYHATWNEGTVSKIFGTGPGTFFKDWAKYKPRAINKTSVWNEDFHSGIGFLPTRAVTLGSLGILAIVLILLAILYEGKRGLFPAHDRNVPLVKREFFAVLYIPLLYLWVLLLFDTPGVVLVSFSFIFLGMSLGFLERERFISAFSVSGRAGSKVPFVFTAVTVLLLIGSLLAIYVTVKHYRGEISAQQGVLVFQQKNDVKTAESYLLNAVNAQPVDKYYRNLAELGTVKMKKIAQTSDGKGSVNTDQLEKVFRETIAYAQKAKDLDPGNYHNWVFLGNLYRFFATLHINGADDASRGYYQEALKRIPYSPEVNLDLARLSLAGEDAKQAKVYLDKALEYKPNYVEADIVKAKMALQNDDKKTATTALVNATQSLGRNPTLWYQVGVLLYQSESYTDASQALENALVLVPNYANAQFYLALSYAEGGKKPEAQALLEVLAKKYPKNEQVAQALLDVKGGKTPSEPSVPPGAGPPVFEGLSN